MNEMRKYMDKFSNLLNEAKEGKKPKKNNNEFNPDEFEHGFTGSSSGKKQHSVSKHSRSEKTTSCTVTVKDKTNNKTLEGKIPEGNYSKKEMQKLRQDMVDKLMKELHTKRK